MENGHFELPPEIVETVELAKRIVQNELMPLEPEFLLISPDGQRLPRKQLAAALRGRNSCHPPESGFNIWIRNYICRHVGREHVLVTYEEWQHFEGEERARLSSAVFLRHGGGVRWLHVQETWLPADG